MAKVERVKIINDEVCLSTAEMSALLSVDKDTVNNWGKRGCPKAGHGYWPLAAVLRWRGMVGTSGPETEEGSQGKALTTQKLEAEVRYKVMQAENQELKNAIAKGEYLERSEVVGELTRCFMILKRSLTGVVRKMITVVGPFVDPATARRIETDLNEALHDALEQLSVNGVYVAHGTKTKRT